MKKPHIPILPRRPEPVSAARIANFLSDVGIRMFDGYQGNRPEAEAIPALASSGQLDVEALFWAADEGLYLLLTDPESGSVQFKIALYVMFFSCPQFFELSELKTTADIFSDMPEIQVRLGQYLELCQHHLSTSPPLSRLSASPDEIPDRMETCYERDWLGHNSMNAFYFRQGRYMEKLLERYLSIFG